MEGVFRAARLRSDSAQRAFALVQFFDPALTLEDWTAFVNAADEPSHDMLAIEDARGYTHAVFSHRVEHDLRYGRVLRLSALACSGVPSRVLHDAILASAEKIAREAHCTGIILELAEQSAPGLGDPVVRGLEATVRSTFARVASSYYRALPRGDA